MDSPQKSGGALRFYKMQALGNDYLLFDGVAGDALPAPAALARLCRRKTGVGADGALLLTRCRGADARLRIFNADGSEAEQCGNGLRCAAFHLFRAGHAETQARIATAAGVFPARLLSLAGNAARIEAGLGRPVFLAEHLRAQLCGDTYLGAALSVGNPHASFPVPDPAALDLAALGGALQRHPFFPRGVNGGFWRALADNRLELRVYERGVGPTDACGTGAAAAAAAAVAAGDCDGDAPVEVLQAGGALTVRFGEEGEAYLAGEARFVFAGLLPEEGALACI